MDFIILRLVHILSGAFWFGSVVTTFLFVQPVVIGMGLGREHERTPSTGALENQHPAASAANKAHHGSRSLESG